VAIIPRRLAVFASGGGSNLQAILDYLDALGPAAPARLVVVASDRALSPALDRARARGIAAEIIGRPADGAALRELLERHEVDLVALAGYLRLVPAQVTGRWRGAILNVHPALLPRFGGAGMYGRAVHRAVLEAGEAETGATAHFVDEHYDRGAVVARVRVPVEPGDTPERLAARVLAAEHALYPRALHAVAAGWIALDREGRAIIIDRPGLASGIPASAFPIEFAAAEPSPEPLPTRQFPTTRHSSH
jgi:phosphoribosylglycinamide formyltransferase-1